VIEHIGPFPRIPSCHLHFDEAPFYHFKKYLSQL
jgi:hypothetical protein